MKFDNIVKLFAPAVVLLAISIPASASLVNANADFAIGFTGTLSYNPGDPSGLLAATSITLPSNTLVQGERITGLDSNYLGNPNDFCNSGDCSSTLNGLTPLFLGQTISLSSQTLDLTGASLPTLTLSSTSPADPFTFTASSILVQRSHVGNADFVNVFYSGVFNDNGTIYNPNLPASLSFSFTQTGGASGSVSGSGTFATPPQAPPSGAPEPATMALMGSALVGLGMFGRKRLSR